MTAILFLFSLLVPGLPASTSGCEFQPEVRQALDTIDRRTQVLKYAEAMVYIRKTLDELLARYPREIAVHRKYVEFIKRGAPDAMPALRAKYQQEAERNPQDAFAVYMAGYTLQEFNTPESLRLVQKAKALDPGIPWTYVTLASMYGRGKLADKAKSAEIAAGYYRACPASLDEVPLQMVGRFLSPDAQREIVKSIRARLEQETDPARLELYAEIWGIEFRTTPIPEHPALRKQVAADVQRLIAANPTPDARWLDLLKNGMKQSGASKEALKALDDRILREFPASPEARWILIENSTEIGLFKFAVAAAVVATFFVWLIFHYILKTGSHMTKVSKRVLYWTPRTLSIAFIAFLSLFALDVFGPGQGFWKTLLALTMHLIPSLVLIAALVLAWRWEWIGAAVYAGVGGLYVWLTLQGPVPATIKLSWILTIAGPAFVIAAMFLWNWVKHDELRAKD